MTPALRRTAVAGLVALLAVLPLVLRPYEVERLATTLALAVGVLGLVVLTGWSGQISLGHGALFGLGAYTTAVLVVRAGWPHLTTTAVAALLGLVVGAVAGLPALRVAGIYLALVSLSLATVFPTLVQHWDALTGGTQGMAVPAFRPWTGALAQDQWGYYVALAVAVPAFLLVHDLGRGRLGRALRAVRDDELAAQAMGIPVAAVKVGAFALSGALAATAGSLSVLVQPFPYLDARSYTIALSIALVTGLVVGGAASVAGAAVGALFLERVPLLVTDVAHLPSAATDVLYGGLLVALMLLAPGGAAGLVAALRARRSRPPAPAPAPARERAPVPAP